MNDYTTAKAYAHAEWLKLRGRHQKLDKIEELLELADGDVRSLDACAFALLHYIIRDLSYDLYYSGRVSRQAVERFEGLMRFYKRINKSPEH